MIYPRHRLALVTAIAVLAAVTAMPSADAALSGRVSADAGPLVGTSVVAYQLADLTLHRTVTDNGGSFVFDPLPAGLYKIIAFKAGFAPAVAMLTRSSADAAQYVDLELQAPSGAAEEADFWTLRTIVPNDVLRDLMVAEYARFEPPSLRDAQALRVTTNVEALAGVDGPRSNAMTQVSGGSVDVDGEVGALRIGLDGRFLEAGSEQLLLGADAAFAGSQRLVSLSVRNENDDAVRVTSVDNQIVTTDGGIEERIGLESHGVTWSQSYGERGRSDFSAQFTSENNFHLQGPIEPGNLPSASRSWRVEAAYSTSFGERSTVQAGVRFRERRLVEHDTLRNAAPQEHVEVFGRGGYALTPSLLIEYGMTSSMADGGLAVQPRAGLVLSLGPDWRLSTAASRRVQDATAELLRDYHSVLYDDYDSCEQAESSCYEIVLARNPGEIGEVSFGAVDRRFDETLRLYFDESFLSRPPSLYLVDGDRVPEVRFSVSRRLTPKIVARLASSLGSGGGGMLYADRAPHRNEVRYHVTRLATEFERTSTGVDLAYRQVAQRLDPVAGGVGPAADQESLEMLLTQDLAFLDQLSSNWALQLNMEVSRDVLDSGAAQRTEELVRRVMGGIAVRF